MELALDRRLDPRLKLLAELKASTVTGCEWYATAMTRTPTEMSDELFAALSRHLDEPQMLELATAVALENLRARFNDALGIESQNFSEGSFCAIPERERVAA